MSISYILLLFSCLGVVASCKVEHKDIGWKVAGSKSNLTIEEAEHIAKFQSFAAPDGEVAQNQTDEEAEHIAEYYINVFNKLVEVNNFTELALYFENEFEFKTCISAEKKIDVDKDYFLQRVYNEQANWKLVDAGFMRSNKIYVMLYMNMFGYVDLTTVELINHRDGSWQWSQGKCRYRNCVDPKNT